MTVLFFLNHLFEFMFFWLFRGYFHLVYNHIFTDTVRTWRKRNLAKTELSEVFSTNSIFDNFCSRQISPLSYLNCDYPKITFKQGKKL